MHFGVRYVLIQGKHLVDRSSILAVSKLTVLSRNCPQLSESPIRARQRSPDGPAARGKMPLS